MPRSLTNKPARWWIATIPVASGWMVPTNLVDPLVFICGQQEIGSQGEEGTGYAHWQVYLAFSRNVRMGPVKAICGETSHVEPTKSDAARAYCTKEDTSVPGTRFNMGEEPFRRNVGTDWAAVKKSARLGNLDEIPDDIYIRYITCE